jgi:hypothetical protein
MAGRFDVTDVVVLVGVLLVAVGLYLQFGGAWAVMFVGVLLVVMGLLSAMRRGRIPPQPSLKQGEGRHGMIE